MKNVLPEDCVPVDEDLDVTPWVRNAFTEVSIGSVFDEKYLVSDLIGRGPNGVVFGACEVSTGLEVAIKLLPPWADQEQRFRFTREGRVSSLVGGRNTMRALATGSSRGDPYIVFERHQGVDLRRKLAEVAAGLPIDIAIRFGLDICEGLIEAHEVGIVHRDIKPSNLFVCMGPGGAEQVRIIDFGICKWRDVAIGDSTAAGAILGTPKYMAPEQVFGDCDVDVRSDVWAVGVVLYEMLAGRAPYLGATLPRFCEEMLRADRPDVRQLREIPADLADIIDRCLSMKPEDRFPSAVSLACALRAVRISGAPSEDSTLPQRTDATRMWAPGMAFGVVLWSSVLIGVSLPSRRVPAPTIECAFAKVTLPPFPRRAGREQIVELQPPSADAIPTRRLR